MGASGLMTHVDDVVKLKRKLAWEIARFAFDIGGIADPSPTCDAIGLLMSVASGDWLGAGVNAVSMVPYFGDTAKALKIPHYISVFCDALKIAKKDAEFAKALMPAFTALRDVLRRVPIGSLPEPGATHLAWMVRKLDDVIQSSRTASNVFRAFADFPRMTGWSIGQARNWLAKHGFSVVKRPKLDRLGRTDSIGGSEIWFRRQINPDGTPGPIEAVRIDARGHTVKPEIHRELTQRRPVVDVKVAAGEPRHMHKELIDPADASQYLAGGIRKQGKYWQPASYDDAGSYSRGNHAASHIWLTP